jgi:hypothetical protein
MIQNYKCKNVRRSWHSSGIGISFQLFYPDTSGWGLGTYPVSDKYPIRTYFLPVRWGCWIRRSIRPSPPVDLLVVTPAHLHLPHPFSPYTAATTRSMPVRRDLVHGHQVTAAVRSSGITVEVMPHDCELLTSWSPPGQAMTCYAAPEDEAAAALALGGDSIGPVAERDCPWCGCCHMRWPWRCLCVCQQQPLYPLSCSAPRKGR